MDAGLRAAAAVADVFLAAGPHCAPCDAVRRFARQGRAASRAAVHHGVGPLLHERLSQARLASLLTTVQREALRASFEHAGLRAKELRRMLASVLSELHEAGVPVVLLKGAALAETVYRSPALRPMTDVDLLVPAADGERAAGVLRELGLRRADGDPRTFALHHGAPFVGAAAPIELHVDLVPDAGARLLPASDVIARSVQITALGGVPARVPAPADMLLHLCLHATHAHRMRARLLHLMDIRLTLEGDAGVGSLDALVERAVRSDARALAYCALRLAHDLVGAPVPAETLRALRRGPADDLVVEHARTLVLGGPLPPPGIARFVAARGAVAKGLVALEALRRATPANRRRSTPRALDDLGERGRALAALALRGLGATAELVRARDAVSTWLSEWDAVRLVADSAHAHEPR